mgnify:CR=1 FL=1
MAEERKNPQGGGEKELSEILQIRRDKLAQLRAEGQDPYVQTRYHVTARSQTIKDRFDELEHQEVSLAGRLMSKRGMGKVSFCDLQDTEGRIQLYARKDEMDEAVYNRFKKLDIGDIIGVRGEVFRTQRGEMSVRVLEFTLLSKSLLPLPEKFHGLTDLETRYRQRYVDLMVNPEVKKNDPAAAKMSNQIVEFVFSGDHEVMNMMAFGNQAVDFERDGTADNSHIQRMNEIEQWAIDLYDWMTKKYGEENIIGFDVHLDETTAHCHATIIPVVMRTEKKTGRERPVVSYKGLFGKDKATGQEIMKQLHTELYEQVNSKYGLMRGDPVEISGAQHKDKVQMYYQLKRELPELENRAIELRIFISKLELQYKGLSHQIESLKQDLENKKITLDEYGERTSELMKQKIALGDKIRDRKSRLMQCENQIASLRQRQANAEVAVRQAANNVERMKESQLGNSVMMVKGAIFDELLSGLRTFLDNMPQPTAYALQSVQGTVVEDLFDGSLSDVISRAAVMVTAAIGDATTPMYSGGGGGSSSDDKPKKDDDEDWWRFAHRAARYASRNKPSKSATRSPRR